MARGNATTADDGDLGKDVSHAPLCRATPADACLIGAWPAEEEPGLRAWECLASIVPTMESLLAPLYASTPDSARCAAN
jgi:hypothetical protein